MEWKRELALPIGVGDSTTSAALFNERRVVPYLFVAKLTRDAQQ